MTTVESTHRPACSVENVANDEVTMSESLGESQFAIHRIGFVT